MSRARRTRIAVPGSTAAVTRAILVTPAARRAAGAPAAIVILAVEARIRGMEVVSSARQTIPVQTAYALNPSPAYSALQPTIATKDTIARGTCATREIALSSPPQTAASAAAAPTLADRRSRAARRAHRRATRGTRETASCLASRAP